MDDAFASGALDFQFSTGEATAADSLDETDPSLKAGDVGGLEEQLAMFSPEVQQQVFLQLMAQRTSSTESLNALTAEGTENAPSERDLSNEVFQCLRRLPSHHLYLPSTSFPTLFLPMRAKANATLFALANTLSFIQVVRD